MDFGLREWLIIIGLLVISGILFDGWRRMGGRSRVRIKLERNFKGVPEAGDDDELLGPPRVIGQDERAEPSFGEDLNEDALAEEPVFQEPQQGGLNLEEPAQAPPTSPLRFRTPRAERVKKEPVAEPAMSAVDDEKDSASRDSLPVEEILIINVIARGEEGFLGSEMMQSIMESGLRYGDMDIFHRHESMTGNGDVLFSMANALKPGTFDLEALDTGHVRAVSFFMGLPGPRHPKQALDLMIASARKLAQELGGDLKDESRSVLTAQTIEHYRQRIAEFERKRFGLRR